MRVTLPDTIVIFITLGLEEHIAKYIFYHPELAYSIFVSLVVKRQYDVIRRHPQLVAYIVGPTLIRRSGYAMSIRTSEILRLLEEAPDIAEIILTNINKLPLPNRTLKELRAHPLTSKYFTD